MILAKKPSTSVRNGVCLLQNTTSFCNKQYTRVLELKEKNDYEMKRKKHTSGDDEAQIDMTPMLDIVFIMLIFFIVTTSFVKEKGLDVNRPDENQSNNNQPSKSLSIRIDANGVITMGGREVDVRRVVANAQTFLAENNTDSAAIQADKDTEHGLVVEVMNQVKIAGIDKVSVLVKDS